MAVRPCLLEGDGSALMSLGNLPLMASESPANLVHVVLHNGAYESTGAQPSISSSFELVEVAQRCGYRSVVRAEDLEGLETALLDCAHRPGLHFIQVKAAVAPAPGIPRVSHPPTEIRDRFKGNAGC